MTPRQIAAYTFLASRRKERELQGLLATISLGSSGDSKAINKQIDDWEKYL